MKIENHQVIKRFIVLSIIIIFIGITGYILSINIQKAMMKGEHHAGLNKIITQELFDSIKIGLEKYKLLHDHYPKYSGKYFFDSIKTLISISDVYIYSDTLTKNGKSIPIKRQFGEDFDYKNIPNTYLGIGNNDLYIIYKYISDDSFRLYSVGENNIDENGYGDDMQY